MGNMKTGIKLTVIGFVLVALVAGVFLLTGSGPSDSGTQPESQSQTQSQAQSESQSQSQPQGQSTKTPTAEPTPTETDGGVAVSTPTPTSTPTAEPVDVPSNGTYVFDRGSLEDETANRTAFENAILSDVNTFRVNKNTNRLAYESLLKSPLRKHAADMARRGYLDNESPDGTSVQDRIGTRCDPAVAVAKVNFQDTASPSSMADDVVSQWTESEAIAARLANDVANKHNAAMVQAEDGDVYVVYAAC